MTVRRTGQRSSEDGRTRRFHGNTNNTMKSENYAVNRNRFVIAVAVKASACGRNVHRRKQAIDSVDPDLFSS